MPFAEQLLRRDCGTDLTNLTLTHGGISPKPTKAVFYYYPPDFKNYGKVLTEKGITQKSTNETEQLSTRIRASTILKSSGKFTFVEASKLFDINNIDREMTLHKFKALRKKSDVAIEDHLFRERYD